MNRIFSISGLRIRGVFLFGGGVGRLGERVVDSQVVLVDSPRVLVDSQAILVDSTPVLVDS